jgi:hypothetical protein
MRPPPILQIYREYVNVGAEAAYDAVETDAASVCRQLGCPNPYLAIESLSPPGEVWFFNGYDSTPHRRRVEEAYAANAPVMARFAEIAGRKKGLVGKPIESLAHHRPHPDRRTWSLGEGRFLAIAITNDDPRLDGTLCEAADGLRFTFAAAADRGQAEAKAAAWGPAARVFAVRPRWSMPAREWVDADPGFWNAAPE